MADVLRDFLQLLGRHALQPAGIFPICWIVLLGIGIWMHQLDRRWIGRRLWEEREAANGKFQGEGGVETQVRHVRLFPVMALVAWVALGLCVWFAFDSRSRLAARRQSNLERLLQYIDYSPSPSDGFDYHEGFLLKSAGLPKGRVVVVARAVPSYPGDWRHQQHDSMVAILRLMLGEAGYGGDPRDVPLEGRQPRELPPHRRGDRPPGQPAYIAPVLDALGDVGAKLDPELLLYEGQPEEVLVISPRVAEPPPGDRRETLIR